MICAEKKFCICGLIALGYNWKISGIVDVGDMIAYEGRVYRVIKPGEIKPEGRAFAFVEGIRQL